MGYKKVNKARSKPYNFLEEAYVASEAIITKIKKKFIGEQES